MVTVGECAYRRYGRAIYDVTPRLAEVGDELYIRTRASLDGNEVEDINDRLGRCTYSQSCKAFPRRSPASPRITVVIASPSAPFNDVSQRHLDEITSRLLRPTLVSRLRRTEPAPRSTPTPPPRSPPPRRPQSRLHPPGYVPPGILRLQPSSPDREKQTGSASPKVRFSIRAPVRAIRAIPAPVPAASRADDKNNNNNNRKPIDNDARSKSAPARAQRTLPDVNSPKAQPRRERVLRGKTEQNSQMSSPRKSKKSRQDAVKSSGGKPKPATARSHSSSGTTPKRLGFIATILETDDEYN